jgi:hypothetical protein
MTGSTLSTPPPPPPLMYSLDRLRENLVVWLWMGSFFFIICGICDSIPMHIDIADYNNDQQQPMVLAALEGNLSRESTLTLMPPLKTAVGRDGLVRNDENHFASRTDALHPRTHFLRGRKRQPPITTTTPRQRGLGSKQQSSWQPTLQEEVWALDLLLPTP